MKKGFKQIAITAQAKERLQYLSAVSHVSMSKLLESYIEALFGVGMYYKQFNMMFDYENAENRVIIQCHGIKSKENQLFFGTSKTEFDMVQTIFDKINKDLQEKALR